MATREISDKFPDSIYKIRNFPSAAREIWFYKLRREIYLKSPEMAWDSWLIPRNNREKIASVEIFENLDYFLRFSVRTTLSISYSTLPMWIDELIRALINQSHSFVVKWIMIFVSTKDKVYIIIILFNVTFEISLLIWRHIWNFPSKEDITQSAGNFK